jgi:hypothetical protein
MLRITTRAPIASSRPAKNFGPTIDSSSVQKEADRVSVQCSLIVTDGMTRREAGTPSDEGLRDVLAEAGSHGNEIMPSL